MAGLTDQQCKQFEEDGYLVLPCVFTRREVNQMAAEADRLAQWQVAISLALGEPTPRLDARRRDGHVVLRAIQPVNDVSPVFTRYSNDERLVRPLRELLGTEPVLVEEQLDYRRLLPGDPDVANTSAENDGQPPLDDTLTSVIAIDALTAGALWLVPGSHIGDDPHTGPIPVEAPAGSVVILHPDVAQGSTPEHAPRLLLMTHSPGAEADAIDERRRAGQAAEDRYAELVYSGVPVPEYKLSTS